MAFWLLCSFSPPKFNFSVFFSALFNNSICKLPWNIFSTLTNRFCLPRVVQQSILTPRESRKSVAPSARFYALHYNQSHSPYNNFSQQTSARSALDLKMQRETYWKKNSATTTAWGKWQCASLFALPSALHSSASFVPHHWASVLFSAKPSWIPLR